MSKETRRLQKMQEAFKSNSLPTNALDRREYFDALRAKKEKAQLIGLNKRGK